MLRCPAKKLDVPARTGIQYTLHPTERFSSFASTQKLFCFSRTFQIFKANFSPSQGIIVAYFRDEIQVKTIFQGINFDQLQFENEVGRWGFNSIARGCEKYVTRLCDDSNNHSSFVNVTNEECKGWQVRRIHR